MVIDYPGVIGANAAGMVAVARGHPLDTAVPSCPGWDLGQLLVHLGKVFRWSAAAVIAAGEPPGARAQVGEGQDVVEWFAASADELVATIQGIAPDAPAWNFTGANAVAGFWPRRQAHESTVHLWDARTAIGEPTAIDAALAVDGIDEYLTVVAPYLVGRRDGIDTGGSVHLHATDADGEWTVHTDDGVLRVDVGHAKGDVALRGPAAQLLLVLWQRVPVRAEGLQVFGDAAVLDRWLELGTP